MGINRSVELIQLAQELSGATPNLSFAVADVPDFQPARPFDVITITRTLQWIEQLERMLAQDGYITEAERQAAITAYARWIKDTAQSMRPYLVATHATFG